MNMVDTPTSPPKLTRSTIIREFRYTFTIQPRFIMRDMMKRDLLQPLEKTTQDDNTPIGKYEAFCTYHQQKVHATNFCKVLEATNLDLITKGKYEIDYKD